jgi:DNA-binding MarR family transcriptional regulator
MTPQSSKKTVAAEVWRLMLDTAMAQFGQASGVLQSMGLTPGHMKLMMKIDEGDGRPMGALAHSFQCDASTMTWLVDKLEERGLVERRALPSDRRVKAVALTPLGVKTKAELMEHFYEPPSELLELDRTSLESLRDTLAKIRNSEQEVVPPVPAAATSS